MYLWTEMKSRQHLTGFMRSAYHPKTKLEDDVFMGYSNVTHPVGQRFFPLAIDSWFQSLLAINYLLQVGRTSDQMIPRRLFVPSLASLSHSLKSYRTTCLQLVKNQIFCSCTSLCWKLYTYFSFAFVLIWSPNFLSLVSTSNCLLCTSGRR